MQPNSNASTSKLHTQEFVKQVWSQGKVLYRDLPWRNIDDPYAVFVSEVMLQQTQVRRVIDYWQRFMSLFPTLDALASSDSALVLEQWQGLGYNRRALSLKKAAEICAKDFQGQMPRSDEELQKLPGIGPATAAGIRAFALRQPSVYIETNVRAVYIHHFFPDAQNVKDADLYPLVKNTCSNEDPRGWYYALLDYGARLKALHANPARKSAHHVKQSSFEGSRRQKRAALLRFVLESPGIGFEELFCALNDFELQAKRPKLALELFESILDDMLSEGFFKRTNEGDTHETEHFFA